MYIDKIKYAITVKASFIIFCITLTATIIRPLVIEQDIIFTYIGAVNSAILGAVFLYIRHSEAKHWHPLFFVSIGIMVLAPIAFVSGGVNSQFAFLFPIIPFFIALVSSTKYTWITTLVLIGLIVVMLVLVEWVPNYTYENVPENKTESRALWLCLSILLSTTFGIEFNRINSALGNKLSEQAEIDALTGVANRRSTMDYLKMAINTPPSSEHCLAVMMIDLDHFKLINDTYGHLAGDECLKSAARSLTASVRDTTDFVGRYGGEEFIAIINTVSQPIAMQIADNIRKTIEQQPVQSQGQTIRLTTTIGVVISNRFESVEHCLEQADKALYKGKKAGRNCVVLAQ